MPLQGPDLRTFPTTGISHPTHPGQYDRMVPPTWGPEMKYNQSFLSFSRDLENWVRLTTLTPRQQVASFELASQGTVKQLLRDLPHRYKDHGGYINGVKLDPFTYIV